MGRTVISYIVMSIILVLFQVLICNHIMLFNAAMAFVFIYVIISLPMNLSTNWLLTWAFLLGLTVDLFSDTPGLNALACVLLAIMKRPSLYAYVPKDDRTVNIEPSIAELGYVVYTKYLLSMTAIYCVLVFSIEYFSYASVKEIAIMSAASTVFSFMVLLGIDSLVVNKRHR